MTLGGYTDIPETLAEAQAEIVMLRNHLKTAMESESAKLHALNEAVGMIAAARAALNAIERPAS